MWPRAGKRDNRSVSLRRRKNTVMSHLINGGPGQPNATKGAFEEKVDLLCKSWNQFQDTVFTWSQELESMAA